MGGGSSVVVHNIADHDKHVKQKPVCMTAFYDPKDPQTGDLTNQFNMLGKKYDKVHCVAVPSTATDVVKKYKNPKPLTIVVHKGGKLDPDYLDLSGMMNMLNLIKKHSGGSSQMQQAASK